MAISASFGKAEGTPAAGSGSAAAGSGSAAAGSGSAAAGSGSAGAAASCGTGAGILSSSAMGSQTLPRSHCRGWDKELHPAPHRPRALLHTSASSSGRRAPPTAPRTSVCAVALLRHPASHAPPSSGDAARGAGELLRC
eukprot:scaffold442_cov268-Pinguiococcus_pyrenoidosus.AAC.63